MAAAAALAELNQALIWIGFGDQGNRDTICQEAVTEFRQPLQVQIHLEMPRILVQLGHIQRT